MPFLRFSRDKRGYEHTYLVDTIARRGKPSRTRVLYWYRTPPGVRVGRTAFDPDVRLALEARYPNVTFDWEALASTPMPPPEPEYWRERRRAERAVKQARRHEEQEDAPDREGPEAEPSAELSTEQEGDLAVQVEASPLVQIVEPADVPPGVHTEPAAAPATSGDSPNQAEGARRRRRRGGRRRRPRSPEAAPGTAPGSDSEAAPSDVPEPDAVTPPDSTDSSSEDE